MKTFFSQRSFRKTGERPTEGGAEPPPTKRPKVVLVPAQSKGSAIKQDKPADDVAVDEVGIFMGPPGEADGMFAPVEVDWGEGLGDVILKLNIAVVRGEAKDWSSQQEDVVVPKKRDWKTIQFKHPRSQQLFNVESNDMFIGMIKLFVTLKATQLMQRRGQQTEPDPATTKREKDANEEAFEAELNQAISELETVEIPISLVRTNWKHEEEEADDRLAMAAACCSAAGCAACWAHWTATSPMRPINLICTAGLGLLLSIAVSTCAYLAEQIAGEGVEFLLDVKSIGAIAALSTPSFLALITGGQAAFGVERHPANRYFKLLRFCALGLVATPCSFVCLVVFAWLQQPGKLISAFLWLGSALLQIALHRQLFSHRRRCFCGAYTDAVEEDEVEAYHQQQPAAAAPHDAAKHATSSASASHASEAQSGDFGDGDGEGSEGEGEAGEGSARLAALRASCARCCAAIGGFAAMFVAAVRQLVTLQRCLRALKFTERAVEGLVLLAAMAIQICVASHNLGTWYEVNKPPGQMLWRNEEGHLTHMVCRGFTDGGIPDRKPVVVLEGMEGLGMVGAMEQLLLRIAKEGVACAYDRAGFGRSHPGPGSRTPKVVAAELAYMLINGSNYAPPKVDIHNVPRPILPPFIVVGHSTGSVYARQFAVDFPELTAALVSLDGMPVQPQAQEEAAGSGEEEVEVVSGEGEAEEGSEESGVEGGGLVGVSEVEGVLSGWLLRACRNLLQPLGITRALEWMVASVLLPGADRATSGYSSVFYNLHHGGWCTTVLRERASLQEDDGRALGELAAREAPGGEGYGVPLVVWVKGRRCVRGGWSLSGGCNGGYVPSTAVADGGLSWLDWQRRLANASSTSPVVIPGSPESSDIAPLQGPQVVEELYQAVLAAYALAEANE